MAPPPFGHMTQKRWVFAAADMGHRIHHTWGDLVREDSHCLAQRFGSMVEKYSSGNLFESVFYLWGRRLVRPLEPSTTFFGSSHQLRNQLAPLHAHTNMNMRVTLFSHRMEIVLKFAEICIPWASNQSTNCSLIPGILKVSAIKKLRLRTRPASTTFVSNRDSHTPWGWLSCVCSYDNAMFDLLIETRAFILLSQMYISHTIGIHLPYTWP